MLNLTPQSSPSELFLALKVAEQELARRASLNQLANYEPYDKQREFHAAGRDHRERLLMAGNQLGKTLSAGAETAMHLTGRYPDWWDGYVFNKPISAWVSGITGESTRDNPQRILYGPLGKVGTGMLPLNSIKDFANKRGLADALDTLVVRWGGGGDVQAQDSLCGFKSNDQGREKWQGPTLGLVWFDEEHDEDIYAEGLTRTNVAFGPVMTTFTPLKGMSNVVKRFLIDKVGGTHVTQMTIDDALHYTPEARAAIVAAYLPHEREARAKGIPTMGSGRVFPIEEEFIRVTAFPIPDSWLQLGGLDFGWDHPSAGIRMAWDRDNDCLYVTACHRARENTPAMFAAAVRPWGDWLRWSWPHDGLQHDKGSGEQLAAQYKAQGLKMMSDRATFVDGTNGLEAGVLEMLDRMQTGRLKVFSHLNDWFEEFRLYHRKEGLIVKLNDDLMSATRYAMMMRRHGTIKSKRTAGSMGASMGGWQG
jgi:phage terminase large subunit-like protein